jgi:acetylserotonin N-methyltransferase
MSAPDAAPILEWIEAFRRSKAMFAAVSLGLFDLLSEGPADAAALARRTGADAGALARLLDACAALGLLTKSDGMYANEPVARQYLCRASPATLTGYILYSDRVLYPMWAHLEDAVREGTHRWPQAFGLDGPIFDGFFRTDESMRTFVRGMHGFGLLSSPRVVEAFDLSRFRRMVDLGGATGHLVLAACERYPNLRGAVFDLPRVIEAARESVAASPVHDRVALIAGDFFEAELPAADLFALGRILHDWSEEKIGRLLRKIHARLPAGGALLIAEKLLADDGVGPPSANMQSLNMLVITEGRERAPAEYAALLRAAGFGEVAWRRTGAPLDAVLAVKT